jgi:hypothetical protein
MSVRCFPAAATWRCLLFWIALAGAIRPAQAQSVSGAERSGWYMYFGDHPVTPSWSVHLEGQYRRSEIITRWEQLLLRPGVSYDFGHGFTAMLAYTYLRGYPFEGSGMEADGPQSEHRVLEELKYEHKLGRVKLAHRMRAEQRFEGQAEPGKGVTDWEFGERARYRLTADIPFSKKPNGPWPDYVSVYDEVFANFGPHGTANALDQNRTYGALGWNKGKNLQVELGYLFQYSPVANGVVGEQNHALQLTISSTAPFRRGIRKKK